ncbi:MAG: hypothetical protein ABI668_13200 [Sphingorhabdus sp.]
MRSKYLLIALPLFAAAPAFAQSDEVVYVPGTGYESGEVEDVMPTSLAVSDSSADMRDMAAKISDPGMQDGVAAAVERMTANVMQLPVGHLAAAIEDARPGTVKERIHYDSNIADLAGRDAENLPEELGARSREMMGVAGSFAKAFAVMLPEFEKMGREMEEGFRAAKAEARRN